MKTFVTYCVRCMRGCELTISYGDGTVTVEGNTCSRGEEYGKSLGAAKLKEENGQQ